ncbi:HAD family hydrolase [Megasphaera sp.]|uniref:HAD family hydrolase n=1 Tax=Megasphaera sp. TaxID=2023260 RepID=UPI0025D07FBC|nr:HAD family hydrolase [uncultured Megasphaera sp.]
MYKAYVFDFDYTLANSEKGIVMCFQMLFDAEGYKGIPEDAIRRTIGMTMYDATALLTGETDPDRINALITEYKVRFSDKYMTANTHLYPQALPTLRALKRKGARCCIVSTKTRSRIGETLRKYDMGDLIDLVVGVEDVKAAKPAPDGINAVCRHFGLAKKDVLYIGDNTIDGEAARNAGVAFAAVTTGTTKAAEFAALPHVAIMKDLSEILTLS